MTMVLPFPEQHVELCMNTRCHQPNLTCSEWSASRYCPRPCTILVVIIDIDTGTSYSSKLVMFTDDNRVYPCINDIEKLEQL